MTTKPVSTKIRLRNFIQTMNIQDMVAELIFLKENTPQRKKLLLETISSTPILDEEVEIQDWLESLKLCQQNNFFPGAISTKINEIIELINTTPYLDPFLNQICKSDQMPPKLRKAACEKSKKNHR